MTSLATNSLKKCTGKERPPCLAATILNVNAKVIFWQEFWRFEYKSIHNVQGGPTSGSSLNIYISQPMVTCRFALYFYQQWKLIRLDCCHGNDCIRVSWSVTVNLSSFNTGTVLTISSTVSTITILYTQYLIRNLNTTNIELARDG